MSNEADFCRKLTYQTLFYVVGSLGYTYMTRVVLNIDIIYI